MINKWLEDKTFCENKYFTAIEKCQKKVYRKIFFESDIKEAFKRELNKEYMTLPQFSKIILNDAAQKRANETIYIFGFSQISRFHYELIFDLKDFYDIKIFQLNFFSDFKKEEDDPIFADVGWNENEIISKWGKPLRESLEILNALVNEHNINIKKYYLKDNNKKANKNSSLLNLLQKSILENNTTPLKEKTRQDRSIQIAGCPGVYREIETVYNSILHNLTTDKTLKVTDIAIMVFDMKKYINIIRSIFDRVPNNDFYELLNLSNKPFIQYNLSDSTADIDSIFGSAFVSGLMLADGNLTRKDVFDFIINPCFLEAQGLTRRDALSWLEWVDKLNIFYGYNKEDKKNASHANSDLYTWSNALKRRFSCRMTG